MPAFAPEERPPLFVSRGDVTVEELPLLLDVGLER
jgi:hypothetical protein